MRSLSLLPIPLVALALGDSVLATDSIPSGQLHVPLVRRAIAKRTEKEAGEVARWHKERAENKFGSGSSISKRSSGFNLIGNQNSDTNYYGSIAVGTPAVAYDIILDTGSADLWLADNNCADCDTDLVKYDSSASSSFANVSGTFEITYGSGQASGSLASDIVQLAGMEVNNQVFGVCNTFSSGLVDAPVSGLLGLGWKGISSSGATPLWQTLYESNALDSPLMAFQLTRYQNASNANTLEPGGTFTLGAVNSSLYTGDIDYQDLADSTGYWTVQLSNVSVNGATLDVGSGSASYAIVDTGTTLVGGPSDQIAALYAQIPNSAALTGDYDGYYSFPCDTDVSISLSFGGPSWPIAASDFVFNRLSQSSCVGAFFVFSTSSSSSPQWILGDTFLKNVYSVFRASPASVGFASLSAQALAENGAIGTAPTPTIGSVSASVTGTGDTRLNGAGRVGAGAWLTAAGAAGALGAVLL
ncbi:acid protease [Amylostereum chailletii]|nr:acid protease [Amylostereum chailletii]